MNAVGATRRFLILLGLRAKLWIRQTTGGDRRLSARIFLVMYALAMATATAWFCGQLLKGFGAEGSKALHVLASVVLVLQITMGMVAMAVSEFFDVSRLFHLPVKYRETFAAMMVAGVMSPATILLLAPLLGGAMVLDGLTWASGLSRICLCVALVVLGHGIALALNLLSLRMMSRRRMRDLATFLASLAGLGGFLFFQSVSDSGGRLLLSPKLFQIAQWTPAGWLVSLMTMEGIPPYLAAPLLVVLAMGILNAGAYLLEQAFLGETQHQGGTSVSSERALKGFLGGGPIRTLCDLSQRIYLREPQVKALYLQQTILVLAPAMLMLFQRADGPPPVQRSMLMLVAFLPFSQLPLLWSLFGLDGRGLSILLLSGVPHRSLILGRLVTLLPFFSVFNAAVILAFTVLAVILGYELEQAVLLAPLIWLAVQIMNLVMASWGALTSVLTPLRLGGGGRGLVQGQRQEGMGFTAHVMRLTLAIPALFIGGALAYVACWPLERVALTGPFEWLPAVSTRMIMVTVPLVLLCAFAMVWGAATTAGRLLAGREEFVLDRLVDHGD